MKVQKDSTQKQLRRPVTAKNQEESRREDKRIWEKEHSIVQRGPRNWVGGEETIFTKWKHFFSLGKLVVIG